MAVRTETSRTDLIAGNKRGVNGTISAVADNDTWAPGLSNIDWVEMIPQVSTSNAAATWSGGTITFHMEGTESCDVTAWGN